MTPTVTATTIQSQPSTSLSSQLSAGVIVGIVIGALAIIVIFGLLIWACRNWEPQPSPQPQPQVQPTKQKQRPIVNQKQAAPVHPVYTGNAAPIGNGGATEGGVIGNDLWQQPIIAQYNATPPPYNSSMKAQFWRRFSKDS